MTVCFDRIFQSADDVLLFRIGFHLRQILRHGFSGNSHAVAVNESRFEKHFHQRKCAADFDELHHHVFAARLEVSQNGNFFTNASEVID